MRLKIKNLPTHDFEPDINKQNVNLPIWIFKTMITNVPFCIIQFLVSIESKILSNFANILFSWLIGIYLLTYKIFFGIKIKTETYLNKSLFNIPKKSIVSVL